jgi:hypothetical protein
VSSTFGEVKFENIFNYALRFLLQSASVVVKISCILMHVVIAVSFVLKKLFKKSSEIVLFDQYFELNQIQGLLKVQVEFPEF